jgi:hypothetical protein
MSLIGRYLQPPLPTSRVFDFLLLSGSFDLMGEMLALEDRRIDDYPLNQNFSPMFYNIGITGLALPEVYPGGGEVVCYLRAVVFGRCRDKGVGVLQVDVECGGGEL